MYEVSFECFRKSGNTYEIFLFLWRSFYEFFRRTDEIYFGRFYFEGEKEHVNA